MPSKITQPPEPLLMESMAGIIHDLRHLVALIPHHVGCLEKEFSIPPSNSSLGRIHSLVANAAALADTALIADKVMAKTLQASKTVEDFGLLARETLALFQPICDYSKITLEFQFLSPIPLVSIDPSLFPRVLHNLISNAVNVTPNGGKVTLFLKSEGKFLLCEVADTGPGIPESELDRIFSPRKRGKGPKYPGSGLGLFVVRAIVEAHGGEVSASNHGLGGAKISLRIPLS